MRIERWPFVQRADLDARGHQVKIGCVARQSILIVDDEDEAREATASLLSSAGYETIQAANGQEALDRLDRISKPVAVLLDLMMPVMNGLEVIEELSRRRQLSELNVLIVSASDNMRAAHDVARRLPLLSKPFSAERLLDFVESQCSGRHKSS
jgi:CheY-like chemotaxis protein